MGKVRFDIPFEVTAVYVTQIPVTGGVSTEVKEIKMRFMWKDIIGVEEFADHHIFPHHVHIPKCRICTNRGAGTVGYTILVDYDEMADRWSEYINWQYTLFNKAKLN